MITQADLPTITIDPWRTNPDTAWVWVENDSHALKSLNGFPLNWSYLYREQYHHALRQSLDAA